MKDRWKDFEDERWELTDKAMEAEGLADKIAERFWIDREEVFDLIVGEDEEGKDAE